MPILHLTIGRPDALSKPIYSDAVGQFVRCHKVDPMLSLQYGWAVVDFQELSPIGIFFNATGEEIRV